MIFQVAKLEEALQSCHNEVSSHMTQLIDLDRTHHQQVESLNKKVYISHVCVS